jgi:hypothetical protein
LHGPARPNITPILHGAAGLPDFSEFGDAELIYPGIVFIDYNRQTVEGYG